MPNLRHIFTAAILCLTLCLSSAAAVEIRFNSSTGSDTTASGSAGAVVANGTNASYSGSTVSFNTAVDLSAFDADDDVLFLDTTSGRKFFNLTSANDGANTVACANNPAGTSTGLTWGIGGKRATFNDADSRSAFTNAKTGWTISTETDQSISSVITVGVAGETFKVIGSGATRVITQSADAGHFNFNTTGTVIVEDLHFKNSNGSKTDASALRRVTGTGTASVVARRCIFGDATNPLGWGMYNLAASSTISIEFEATDCDFNNCANAGIQTDATSGANVIRLGYCTFRENGTDINCTQTSDTLAVTNCLGYDSAYGIYSEGQRTYVLNSTWHGTTAGDSSGVWLVHATPIADIINCQLTGHGAYGLQVDGTNLQRLNQDYNNYGSGGTANGSGASNITIGSNSLQVDPGYTNAAGGDFSIGLATRQKAFPLNTRTLGASQSNTKTSTDIGVSQRNEPAAPPVILIGGGVF